MEDNKLWEERYGAVALEKDGEELVYLVTKTKKGKEKKVYLFKSEVKDLYEALEKFLNVEKKTFITIEQSELITNFSAIKARWAWLSGKWYDGKRHSFYRTKEAMATMELLSYLRHLTGEEAKEIYEQ